MDRKTARQVRSLAKLLVKKIGKDDLGCVSQATVAEFRSLLLILPKSHGKSARDEDRPLDEILEAAKTLPPEKIGLSPETVNRYLTQLNVLLKFAIAAGHDIPGYKGVEDLRVGKHKRARDARKPWSEADKAKIFAQPVWHGSAGENNRTEPGGLIIHDALYFVPLLANYTLARREEICRLKVDDVGCEDGIYFIDIRRNEFRRLKNMQSARRVPIHPELLRLGFLRYVDAIKAAGHMLIFPELLPQSKATPLGDVFHGEWKKVQDAAVSDAAERQKTFQSFRNAGGDELKRAGVHSELRADILGHGGATVTEERYVGESNLAVMLECLNRLPVQTAGIPARQIRLATKVGLLP